MNMTMAGANPVPGEFPTSPEFDVPWMSAETMDWVCTHKRCISLEAEGVRAHTSAC